MSNWEDKTLGDLFDISSSKRVLEKDWKETGIPFYRAREIVKLAKNGYVNNELFIAEDHYEQLKEEYGVPKDGDIMVSAVGTLGACYLVKNQDKFYYKDASVLRFSPKVNLHPQFILHAFNTDAIKDQIHAVGGSTVGTYTIERAKKTRILLPPLLEQRRIATILDKIRLIELQHELAKNKLNNLYASAWNEFIKK